MRSDTSTVVHLVRHGEVFNPQKILYGRLPDYHLSDRGVRMAQATAEYFQKLQDDGASFGYLAASPMIRAQETAAPIAEVTGLELNTEPLMIEAGNEFEGTRVTLASALRPENWKLIYNPFKPSWGESYREQVQRVCQAIDQARQAAVEGVGQGAHAILVSHQLPIWATRLHFEGKNLFHDPRRRDCGLASVTSLRFTGDDFDSLSYQEPAAEVLS